MRRFLSNSFKPYDRHILLPARLLAQKVDMPNELQAGIRRIGDLIDFTDSPGVKVTLEREEQGIRVDVPWSSLEDYYASWFMGDAMQGLQLKAASPPKQLVFVDTDGSVLLVDCQARGFTSNFVSGVGQLWARHAILGVTDNVDYLSLHGLRSEVSGLYEWFGQRSLAADMDSQMQRVTASIGGLNPTKVDDSLSFYPSWTMHHQGRGSVTLSEVLECESRASDPTSWADLQKTHVGMRDLLVLSRWIAEKCNVVSALREDDPIRMLDGSFRGEQWRDVVTGGQDEAATGSAEHRQHLLKFQEIGLHGITTWLALRDEFARALDPIVSDRFLERVGPDTHMAQVGPGLEALGYLLLHWRDGKTEKEANRASLRQRLDRIVSDVKNALPFDGASWAERTVETYNGIKHANRQLPSDVDLLNSWRQSVLVVRAWVALELGIAAEVVRMRLAGDLQNRSYVARS